MLMGYYFKPDVYWSLTLCQELFCDFFAINWFNPNKSVSKVYMIMAILKKRTQLGTKKLRNLGTCPR